MTSDSQSPPTPQPPQTMTLLQSPPSFHSPRRLGLTNSPRGSPVSALSKAIVPTKKQCGERTCLLDPASVDAPSRSSPTSSSATSPNPSDDDRVYPWDYDRATPRMLASLNGAIVSYDTYNTNPSGLNRRPPTTFSKMLAKAQSLSSSLPLPVPSSFSVMGSGTVGDQSKQPKRRHSILRMSSDRSLSDRPMRKSASVEFALHQDALQKLSYPDRRETTCNATPRRLTFEEKEALYKIRPDLEVGPSPFYKEQLQELQKRNQRRTFCAVFGGILCIMFLMVIYYVLSFA